MPKTPMPPNSLLKWPGGKQSSGKAGSYPGLLKLPAIQGSSAVTPPGYAVVVPPYEWDRRLLDLDALGSAKTTGLSLRAKPVVVQMLDTLIWCNGVDNPKIYDPASGNVYDLGITMPTAAPSLADQGTGSFSGSYRYWIRWKRSDTGEYSCISASDDHTASGAGQYIRVTWTDPSISGVDKADIFRSKTNKAGIYLIDTVDITDEQYDDDTADDDIDISLVPPPLPAPGEGATVPVFDYIKVYQGRLFGIVKSTGAMWWSEMNAPWLFATDSYALIGPDDRDQLSGFGIAENRMFVFKERHTYQIIDSGSPTESGYVFIPQIILVDDATGAASQHAVTAVENTLMFMSGEGKLYQVPSEGGLKAMERSAQLEGTLKRLHTKRLKNVELGYAEHERKVFVAIPTDDAAYNNESLVFDLTTAGWTTADLDMESLHEYRDSDGRGRLCFGNVRGDICQIGVGDGYGARAGTISGSPTSGSLSTLTDSSASFDTGVVGLPVALFDSNWNLLQTNKVAVRDSATSLTTLWAWGTIPDTTHYYVIGGMFPKWRFGVIEFNEWAVMKMVRIIYKPTQGKAVLRLSINDGPFDLYDVINLAGSGHHEAYPMAGGKRGQVEIEGVNGGSPFEVIQIDVDIQPTRGGL